LVPAAIAEPIAVPFGSIISKDISEIKLAKSS